MAGEMRTAMTTVFVTGLKVQAEIGVYRHEIGRVQPLVIDVELDVPTAGAGRLFETLNYENILEAARTIAAGGHIQLVENLAQRPGAPRPARPPGARGPARGGKTAGPAPRAATGRA